MSYYYKKYPEALSDELSIQVGELKNCKDVDEAMEVVANRKVDSILSLSFKNQKIFMKKDLKVELYENIIDWNRINEAMERRNIIVHNNGVVNRRYIKNSNIEIIGGTIKKCGNS